MLCSTQLEKVFLILWQDISSSKSTKMYCFNRNFPIRIYVCILIVHKNLNLPWNQISCFKPSSLFSVKSIKAGWNKLNFNNNDVVFIKYCYIHVLLLVKLYCFPKVSSLSKLAKIVFHLNYFTLQMYSKCHHQIILIFI